jgi:hypothetical protein
MGMDFVDILLRVEESFSISIPFDEPQLIERVQTVGGFYELILEKLGHEQFDGMLATAVFHRLRQALALIAGRDPDDIQESTRLAAIVPLAGRRREWQRLAEELDLWLPDLTRPDGFGLLLTLTSLLGAALIT